MTKMTDLFGDDAEGLVLEQETLGNITLRSHPDDADYMIANYTPKAAYEGAWNPVTLACRGLIFHSVTENILARPLAKFFNYGQAGAPEIALDQEVAAANKYDGSLGIAYIAPNGVPAIATRGSFQSDQAIHATQRLLSEDFSYVLQWVLEEIDDGWTPLFEIIYPENRIVLDYGQKDYLQYLGSVRNDTGAFFPNEEEVLTFGELLSRPPRSNAEGYVVWLNRHEAVKIKQDDYIALHKIVTGLSEKAVWQHIQDGPNVFADFVAQLPDELQAWTQKVGSDLAHQYGAIVAELDRYFIKAVDAAWTNTDQTVGLLERKVLAQSIQDATPQEYWGFMFAIADGKDYAAKVWKLIEPKGKGSRPTNVVEDDE